MRLKLTTVLLIRPIALDDLWPLDPHPRDGIPSTLHVILLDKKCFFLWHFWYIACLVFIKLFLSNKDVYHNGLCNTVKNKLWRTPKWALLWSPIFVCFWPEDTYSSSFFTLNVNLFLWYSLCASFKNKIMVVLTIFIMEKEKIAFFQWFLPHQFSP